MLVNSSTKTHILHPTLWSNRSSHQSVGNKNHTKPLIKFITVCCRPDGFIDGAMRNSCAQRNSLWPLMPSSQSKSINERFDGLFSA